MENNSYNIDNLEEYHNQIIEKIKNSDFGNLYEKNKQIITDNLRKYKIIHMEYGKYGKSEVRSYRNGEEHRCQSQDGRNAPWSFIDNFYIIYISINGDCFGNYLSMYRPFEICINRFNYVCIDWNNELFKEPFNKGLSTISEKILTKTILEDTISKNIIQYFISKSNNLNMCKVDIHHCTGYAGTQFDGVHIYRIFNEGFKFKNIFDLQEEYIPAKLEDKKRLEKEKEEEEEKEKQKRIEKVSKRIEEAQIKIKEEEQQKNALELDKVNFQNKIINELIKDTNNYINYNEAKSIISMIVYKNKKLWYFTKFFDRNIDDTMVANQVLDKFASENKIRVEDSINIFTEHIVDIANIFKINMDILSNEYSKEYSNKYSNEYSNEYSNKYSNKYSNEYSNKYSKKYSNNSKSFKK